MARALAPYASQCPTGPGVRSDSPTSPASKGLHHHDTHPPAQRISARPGAEPLHRTHPAWCDPTRCTADPASQANGYRPGAGGEHRSAPVSLNLTTAMRLPVRDGTAWLTEACAPWLCDAYLRMQVGDLELSMPADDAGRVLGALAALLASASPAEQVIR